MHKNLAPQPAEHPGALAYAAGRAASPGPGVRSFTLAAANKCTSCGARGAGVCEVVPLRDLGRLSAAAAVVTVKPGSRFIEEGDSAEHFFTITAGTARLLKLLPNGRQQIISFPGSGDFLGLAVAERYSYAAEAVEPVQLCRFSRNALRRLMADFPAMEQRLLEYTSHELVLAQEQMLLLGRKTSVERIASFLVARARRSGHCPARGKPQTPVQFTLPMSRADIADYVGLRIETISRTMTQLKASGAIDIISATGIVIRDFEALENLAMCV